MYVKHVLLLKEIRAGDVVWMQRFVHRWRRKTLLRWGKIILQPLLEILLFFQWLLEICLILQWLLEILLGGRTFS